MAKLTAKQQRFADEYLIDLNATQAAIRAGYSEKTAYSIGQRLLKNVEVKSVISKELELIQSKRVADATEVMEYLTSVLRGEYTEQIPLLIGEGVQNLVEKDISAKDRLKAAELLGKRYGLFTDKLELDADMELNINIEYGDADEKG